MVQALRCECGGICGLLTLPREEWEAIESRLLKRGFVLADVPRRVSWRAVQSMLVEPWEDSEYLTAALLDVTRLLLWAKTEDGQRNMNRPKPIPRPGDARREAERAAEAESLIAAARAQGWIN